MNLQDLFVTIGIKADDAAIGRINQGLNKVKATLGGVQGAIMGMAAAFGFQKATGFIFRAAQEMEQLEIAFSTMLGSSEKATKLIKELQTLAATTPFEQKDVLKYGQQLISAGIEADDVANKLKMLGDIAAGVGIDKMPFIIKALKDVRTKNRLMTQEVNQFFNANIRLTELLAKKFNVTQLQISKMIEAGKVSYKDVVDVLEGMTKKGGMFFNMMIKQSKTLGGLLSNIQDVIQMTATEIGKELLPYLKPMAEEFLKWLEANKELIKEKVVDFYMKLIKAFRYLRKYAKELFLAFKILLGIMVAMIALKIINFFHGIYLIVSGLISAVMALTAAQWINMATWIALGVLVAAFLLLLREIYGYFSGEDSLIGRMAKFNGVLKTVLDLLEGIGGIVSGLFIAILHQDLEPLIEGFRKLGDTIWQVFGINWNELMPQIFKDLDLFFDKLKRVTALVSPFAFLLNMAGQAGLKTGRFAAQEIVPTVKEYGAAALGSFGINVGDINVTLENQTNASPVEIGEQFQSKMRDVLYQTQIDLASEVKK